MIVASVTPMMRQYLEIKSGYPDAILFFRLGDFYEMFMEDAVIAARVLDITLTSRNKGAADEIPLCGIPYHSCQPYIARLVEHGYKVAICEQVEDPRSAKGIVKREVVRVVTPGLVTDSDSLKPKENNYLMALAVAGGDWGMAVVDISTGEFRAGAMGDAERLRNELLAVSPQEVLLPDGEAGEKLRRLFAAELDGRMVSPLSESVFALDRARDQLLDFFGCATLEPLGCAEMPSAIAAAGAIIHYLRQTLKGALDHIRSLHTVQTADHMVLDEVARRNLELTGTLFDGSRRGSLLGVLDRTVTSMGARRLRQWLQHPLLDLARINQRHEAVAELADKSLQRTLLRAALDGVHDLERLNGKIAMAHANARDLVALRNSLQRLPSLLDELAPLESELLKLLQRMIDPLDDLLTLISVAVVDDPPLTVREGGMIREGYQRELDELRSISREGKGWIARLEVEERERTGISSLKIRFNRVFGYYIEVTKSHLARIPDNYQRRQTLANAERYVIPALQEYEEKVLGAEERMATLEYDLFQEVRQQVTRQARRIQQTATALADIDVLLSLADLAHDRGYVRPQMEEGSDLQIVEGRHPVIDALQQERFVPNDVLMDTRDNQLLIITGPNMAGKSTFMRQVALIVLLAQVGSLVPAKSARLGVVDRIFTRVGASDNLARGQSTFMVEMIETATILRQATPRSLILLDEIGRGTSTFDGVSIAWAVAEYLHDHLPVAAKTLFATHYHELTDLALTRSRVQNYTIAVREWNDQVIFLRKIVRGGASHSYGIQVARLAGLPSAVVERAKEILANLEGGEFGSDGQPKLAKGRKSTRPAAPQLSLFNDATELLRERLRGIDTSVLTPLEALNILDELKRMA